MRRNERGMALFVVVFLILILMPMLYLLSRRVFEHIRFNVKERQIKSARVLAANVLSDFMRGWSEDHNADHFSPWYLNRLQDYYFSTFGFSRVSFQPDRERHVIGFQAESAYQAGRGTAGRGLTALVRFNADYPRFALVSRGDLDIQASNVRIAGGLWSLGDLTVTGPGSDLGNPVVLNEGSDYRDAAGVTTVAEIYGTGTMTGLSPLAVHHAFSPRLEAPEIKPDYYLRACSYKSAAFGEMWTFTGADGSMLVDGAPVAFSTGSAVLVSDNGNLTLLGGMVRGRVTIAVLNGNVTIRGNISYADAQSSLAVIAQNGLAFDGTGLGNMSVQGLYYAATGGGMTFTGDPTAIFTLTGTLLLPPNQTDLSAAGFGGGLTFQKDPALWTNYPPRLPQKPILVTWRMEGA